VNEERNNSALMDPLSTPKTQQRPRRRRTICGQSATLANVPEEVQCGQAWQPPSLPYSFAATLRRSQRQLGFFDMPDPTVHARGRFHGESRVSLFWNDEQWLREACAEMEAVFMHVPASCHVRGTLPLFPITISPRQFFARAEAERILLRQPSLFTSPSGLLPWTIETPQANTTSAVIGHGLNSSNLAQFLALPINTQSQSDLEPQCSGHPAWPPGSIQLATLEELPLICARFWPELQRGARQQRRNDEQRPKRRSSWNGPVQLSRPDMHSCPPIVSQHLAFPRTYRTRSFQSLGAIPEK
jgi:hypothetical protein